MSYDLRLYPSARGIPDADEALALLEAEECDAEHDSLPDAAAVARAEATVAAILNVDPTLERFAGPPGHPALPIELTSPEGERAELQITIFAESVAVSIPCRAGPKRARRAFARFDACARAVHEVVGYFVFDPQCETAWDPTQDSADPDAAYLPMGPAIIAAAEAPTRSPSKVTAPATTNDRAPLPAKPWWKLW